MQNSSFAGQRRIRVWDLPTRLFHWLLALGVFGAWISVKIGGNAMVWHMRFGYLVLTLLGFRLIWGFVGPEHARFSSFVKGPRAIRDQLRGLEPTPVGHNPLATLSVLAMMAMFSAAATLGLFTSDEIAFDGPMVKHASVATVEFASWAHQSLEWFLIGLVVLHLAAIVVHRVVRGHDLIRPMISGDQMVEASLAVKASRDDWVIRTRAAVIAALVASGVAYLSL